MKPIEDAIADALPLKRSSVDSIGALLTENFGEGTLYGGMSESERQTRKALAVLLEADRVDDPQCRAAAGSATRASRGSEQPFGDEHGAKRHRHDEDRRQQSSRFPRNAPRMRYAIRRDAERDLVAEGEARR